MNSAEKKTLLHCLKAIIDEELCEECPLYGMTGVREAIERGLKEWEEGSQQNS